MSDKIEISLEPEIVHREWVCIEEPEDNSDNGWTPGWHARNRVTGERRCIDHSRFYFKMTPERFRWLVEHNFPLSPGKGPWTNEAIDAAMGDGA